MPSYIGIDPSLTMTSVFALDESGAVVGQLNIETKPQAGVAGRVLRCIGAAKQIRDFLQPHKPALVCIEGYSMGHSNAGSSAIIEFGYELRRMLCGMDSVPRVVEIAPMSLKKHATGSGKGDKTQVIVKMARKFPALEFKTNDEADAAALACIAVQLAGHAEPETVAQREVIAKIEAGPVKKSKRKKAS